MNKKCPNCHVINFSHAEDCIRCGVQLAAIEMNRCAASLTPQSSLGRKILKRAIICVVVCVVVVFGFYLSLLFTSKSLDYNEKQTMKRAIAVLDEKGFSKEVFLLRYLTSFRGNDNWLNASTREENAYAATNFPFEILTIYPDFFTIPQDDTERAMVLLHEAQHLKGADEREAYEYVWRNRQKLGWTRETHGFSKTFLNVEKQTREFAPELFRCDWNKNFDCTESAK